MSVFYVYILTNQNHTVLCTGFSDDLERRRFEHKNKVIPEFLKKYNCDKLVYFEEINSIEEALHREKQIKRYKKDWKHNLIDEINPNWRDLYDDFLI